VTKAASGWRPYCFKNSFRHIESSTPLPPRLRGRCQARVDPAGAGEPVLSLEAPGHGREDWQPLTAGRREETMWKSILGLMIVAFLNQPSVEAKDWSSVRSCSEGYGLCFNNCTKIAESATECRLRCNSAMGRCRASGCWPTRRRGNVCNLSPT
jgi:hypothetical protein